MMECWNIGKVGLGILQYWVNSKIQLYDKVKNGKYPLKTHFSIVPLFHYSMSEAKAHASKNNLYFHLVVEIPRRQIDDDKN
jgi:hypothetical protein